MPSLKEIKTRIASVKSTRKITSAMKMVASSKLHHAQVMIENMLPYEDLLEHILKSFLVSRPNVELPLTMERAEVKRVALIVFASNSSLCGGFNSNTLRMMIEAVGDYRKMGLRDEDIIVYPIGRKVQERVAKLGLKAAGSYLSLADKPNMQECADISRSITEQYERGEIDRVEMIYHHFKSVGSQILTRKIFLPIDLSTEVAYESDRDLSVAPMTARAQEYLRQKDQKRELKERKVTVLNDDFIVEPDINTVLKKLIPNQLHLMLYTALLDSNASEHAARMVAMQTATDNADELLRDLNLQFNKSRQQAITSELLDIVGGTVNN